MHYEKIKQKKPGMPILIQWNRLRTRNSFRDLEKNMIIKESILHEAITILHVYACKKLKKRQINNYFWKFQHSSFSHWQNEIHRKSLRSTTSQFNHIDIYRTVLQLQQIMHSSQCVPLCRSVYWAIHLKEWNSCKGCSWTMTSK